MTPTTYNGTKECTMMIPQTMKKTNKEQQTSMKKSSHILKMKAMIRMTFQMNQTMKSSKRINLRTITTANKRTITQINQPQECPLPTMKTGINMNENLQPQTCATDMARTMKILTH